MTGKENSEQFLFYDIKNSENRIIIFSSQACIDVLKRTNIIYKDGTFTTRPSEFYQVYILHASVNNIYYPVVYALLQRKNKETYIELVNSDYFKDKFESHSIISIDFEYSMVLVITQVFNNKVSVQLYFYHLNQSIWRKV